MTLPENPLAWAVSAFQNDRGALYRVYRDYLEGRHPMPITTEDARRAFGPTFRNFFYNRCATVVDAHADRMRVQGFGSPDEDAVRKSIERRETTRDEAPPTIAQYAQELWDAANMDVYEGQIDKEAFGMGDAYLYVEVDPDDGAVHLWPQRADEVRVLYSDRKPGVREMAAKAWWQDDKHLYLNLLFPDRIEKYRTAQPSNSTTMPTKPEAFIPYQPDGEPWPMPLNLDDTVPMFHIPNNGDVNSYGTSELRDVLPLQDELNRSLIQQSAAGAFGIKAIWLLLNYDPRDEESEAALANFKMGLTSILTVPPNEQGTAPPEVAEFSHADMRQYDLIAEKWDVRISRQSRVPVKDITGETTNESGVAKRLNESGFIAKIEDRQHAFGAVYSAAMTYALRLQGIPVEPGDLRVNWRPASPLAENEVWELIAIKTINGMPFKAALREAGYDPEQIDQILEEIAEEAAEAQRRFDAGQIGPMMSDDGESAAD
jgi:hypothetical protein